MQKSLLTISFALILSSFAGAQDDASGTRLYDAAAPSSESMSIQLASKRGWTLVAEDNTTHPFAGSAVFMNDKLAVVAMQQGKAVDIYGKTEAGYKSRARIRPLAPETVQNLKIVENNSGAVAVSVAFASATCTLRITTGEGRLEIVPDAKAKALLVDSDTQYLVVPDFFGDDLAYNREAFSGRALPAENMCLSLLAGGDAMMMCVWQSSEQTAWLIAAEGKWRTMRIDCMPEKKIWLAFMEGQGIWSLGKQDGFFAPFPAKWRMDVMWVPVGVTQSMDAEKSKEFLRANSHGTFLIYPLDRVQDTPLTAVLPTDVMRNTLGVGPCQYILAVEGMSAEGDPTPNNIMEWVEKQFDDKKEKKVADDIQERLDLMVKHIAEANGRIRGYAAFAAAAKPKLAADPKAAAWLAIVNEMERHAQSGLVPAAAPERANKLAAGVLALIGKDNAAADCKRPAAQLRQIGTLQDHAMARCRMALRRLRQEGRTADGNTPANPAGAAIQKLAEQMLSEKTK